MSNIKYQEDGLHLECTILIKLLDGSDSGYEPLGNVSDLKITSSSKSVDRISKMKGSYGNTLNNVSKPEPTKIDITTDTFSPTTTSMALMGALGYTKQTAKNVSDEEVTAQAERWLKLANRHVKPESITVKLANSTPVEKEHIQIKPDVGMILLDEASGVSKGEKITVSYDTLDANAWSVNVGTKSQFKCAMIVDGTNMTNGQLIHIEIPQATLASNGAMSLISDNFNTMSFSGTPELAAGYDSPMIFTTAVTG